MRPALTRAPRGSGYGPALDRDAVDGRAVARAEVLDGRRAVGGHLEPQVLGGERGVVDGDAGVGSTSDDVNPSRQRDAAAGVRPALDAQLGRRRRQRPRPFAQEDLVAVAQPGLEQRQPGRQLLARARERQRLRRGRVELARERRRRVADGERRVRLELEFLDLAGRAQTARRSRTVPSASLVVAIVRPHTQERTCGTIRGPGEVAEWLKAAPC